MLRSIFTNSFGILTSRVLGFIRDLMTASVLGANVYSDIFFVAFKLPNLFRRIFAEGAFSQVFIPAFTRTAHKARFAVKILLDFSMIILLLTALVHIFSKESASLIALGFDDATLTLAAPYVAINFYYLILIFWVTFFTALLHYKRHFATSAFSPALLNVALIGALFLSKGKAPEVIVTFLSYGVLIGGALQLMVHLIAIKKVGLDRLLWGGVKYYGDKSDQTTQDTKRFRRNFLPAVWGSSTAQISAFIDTILASFLVSGSISYLYYANRIFQLPLALFAIATAIVIFPKISRAIKNNDTAKAHALLHKGFWFLFPLLVLATIGGILLSEEMVWLLFERGAFSAADRETTYLVLIMYLIGLIPFGIGKLFMLWLYAHERQKKAAFISTVALGGNILFSLSLIKPLGVLGLALASSLSGVIYFVMILRVFGLKPFLAIITDKKLIYLLLASLVLIALCLGIKEYISVYL